MLVGEGEQPAKAAGEGVLGHRRVGQGSQLFEAGVRMLQAEPADVQQVVGWGGSPSARSSRARLTRAPATAAARADRRAFASSKLASRDVLTRTSEGQPA